MLYTKTPQVKFKLTKEYVKMICAQDTEHISLSNEGVPFFLKPLFIVLM
ncbi:hypothetical protein HMPREF9099_01199 [Lachnospiraceae bacterium oral taxon 082 str. F0431]|nr:hypothetical protein HMPREF9099_01199 [Lachnospiraceae bacterium oral taxon 082 str. F0431]